MPWTFDPSTRQYRDDATGQTLDERGLRPLHQQLLNSIIADTRRVTGDLANQLITVPEWESEMRRQIKEAFGSSYLLSRGGRNAMRPRDWGIVGSQVRRQYRILNDFSRQIAEIGVTRDRALSRTDMYPRAAVQAYQRGNASAFGDPDLPAWPGDGSTRCLSNCGCVWEIEQLGAEEWQARWAINAVKENCVDCLDRSNEWARLRVGPRRPRARQPAEPEEEDEE